MYKKAPVWPLGALLLVLPAMPYRASATHDAGPQTVQVSAGKRNGDCVRPTARNNRLYRRPNGSLALWNAEAMWQRTLPPIPTDMAPRPDGFIVHNGELHVPWQTGKGTGVIRVVKDAAEYRLLIEGTPGPRIARGLDNQWGLAVDEGNYAPGSVLAGVVSHQLTVDPGTLQRAAHILGLMGLPESQLHRSQPWSAGTPQLRLVKPLALIALGQAFIETLPARLRNPEAREWTQREGKLLAADIAAYVKRPLAIFHSDHRLNFAVDRQGRFLESRTLPDDAVRLVHHSGGQFSLLGAATHVRYPSIFAAAEVGTRSAFDFRVRDTLTREKEFRTGFAAYVEGLSTRPPLERVIEQWIDTLGTRSAGHAGIPSLIHVARLRQALFDKHRALTPEEEHTFLEAAQELLRDNGHDWAIHVVERNTGKPLAAVEPQFARTRIVIEADVDSAGRRIAYYQGAEPGSSAIPSRPTPGDSFSPLIDVLLNTGNGKVRRALSFGEWDFRKFADRLVAKVAADENAHLPPILDRFVNRDPQVLADASRRPTDDWWMDGRHFVRLRNLDGTVQIVETDPALVNGGYNLPGYGEGRGSNISRIVQRHGKWYPSRIIRSGLGPTSDALREHIVGNLEHSLIPGSPITRELLKRAVDTTPYPLLLAAMATFTTAELTPAGEIVLAMGNPVLSRYPTGVYRFSREAAATSTQERPVTPLSLYRERIVHEPSLHGATQQEPPTGATAVFESLMQSGAPVGEFVQSRIGSRQIQALATARRLRTMLRSDEYIVVVGTTGGHSLTLALPVNPASVHLLRSGQAPFSSLPYGTRVIDDWLGIATTSTDYPARVRTVTEQMEARGVTITARENDVLSTVTPRQFADRMLNSPVTFNPWNPSRDPISEERYFNYVLRRYDQNLPATPAGLDWLQTDAEKKEISRYFSASSASHAGVSGMPALSDAALELSQQSHGGAGHE